MSAKQLICELFGLTKDETIFEDFGCALKQTILLHGRLFITESHICFYANIMGLKNKQIIDFQEVESIEKKNVLGFIPNAIEIMVKSGKSYYFCSFAQRNSAYRLLYSIWKGVSFDSQDGNDQPEEEPIDEIPQGDGSQTEHAETDYNAINFLKSDPVDNQKEIMKVIFPVTVDRFFTVCFSEDASFSLADHFHAKGEKEIVLSKWTENPEIGCCTRELNMIIKTPDNPFKDASRCYKVQSFKKEEGDKILISTMTKTLDVPYGSCFQVEERWELSPEGENKEKCMLKCLAWFVFNKSTLFQRKIEDKGLVAIKQDYELYVKNIKDKKVFESQNKKNKAGEIKHDFEKSNPLELDIEETEKKIKNNEEKNLDGKNARKKKIDNKISFDENLVIEKIKSLERIMKINGVFLLILVLSLFLLIVMVNMNMKNVQIKLNNIETFIQKYQNIARNYSIGSDFQNNNHTQEL